MTFRLVYSDEYVLASVRAFLQTPGPHGVIDYEAWAQVERENGRLRPSRYATRRFGTFNQVKELARKWEGLSR